MSWPNVCASLQQSWAKELRRAAVQEKAKVLLFVDQLEELCTLVKDETEWASFLDTMCLAADDPGDPIRVVLTFRDDYLGRLAITSRAT